MIWFSANNEQLWIEREQLEFRCQYKASWDQMEKNFSKVADCPSEINRLTILCNL